MRNYEIMYIVKATLSGEAVNQVVENLEGILTSNGAKILTSKDLGQRELAYEIKKQQTGYYFLLTIETSDDKAIKEFDRLVLINQDVIRHLITKLEK